MAYVGSSITIDDVKKVVRDVVREEIIKLMLVMTPEVSDEEMDELKDLIAAADRAKDEEEVEGLEWLGE